MLIEYTNSESPLNENCSLILLLFDWFCNKCLLSTKDDWKFCSLSFIQVIFQMDILVRCTLEHSLVKIKFDHLPYVLKILCKKWMFAIFTNIRDKSCDYSAIYCIL